MKKNVTNIMEDLTMEDLLFLFMDVLAVDNVNKNITDIDTHATSPCINVSVMFLHLRIYMYTPTYAYDIYSISEKASHTMRDPVDMQHHEDTIAHNSIAMYADTILYKTLDSVDLSFVHIKHIHDIHTTATHSLHIYLLTLLP